MENYSVVHYTYRVRVTVTNHHHHNLHHWRIFTIITTLLPFYSTNF